jgi:sulfate-transporting ATPase
VGVIRFALLGIGAGAVYALAAQGMVLVYRGSGVLNFAHGAIGMVGAFCFYLWRADGMSTPVAFVLALLLGAAIGAATHLLVMRPLRRAPALSRLIATLGLLTFLLGLGLERWGDRPRIVAKVLPTTPVEVLPDAIVGKDRLLLFGIAVCLTVVLFAVYRWTRFGLATTAVAESRRATATLGISPDVIATVNWAVGTTLAVAAAILIVNVTGLQVQNLTLLVVPGVAAALVGGFRSFGLTLAGGLAIGILESEVAFLQTKVSDPTALAGWGRAVPFLVIILVLVVRGRALPLRSETIERPPAVGDGRVRPAVVGPLVAAAIVFLAVGPPTNILEASITTASIGIIVLSLTVVTGYAGQLSLAQFALAGTGAWIATRLIANYDMPFELAAIVAILGTIPVGVAVGLPALRTRGVNLAVATLGLSLVVESLVLNNSKRTGGITGTQIGSVRLFGADFDATRHPERYAVLTFACFVVVALVVANLRRGRAGRRLVAVRTNERAAAALGIDVIGVKLYAFALSAAIAAVGGVLIGYHRPSVVFYPTFSVFESILVIVYGVIGGVGFVVGALLGAALAPGALVATLSGSLLDSASLVQLLLGALVVVILMRLPNGLASLDVARVVPWLRRRDEEALADDDAPHVAGRTLEARDVSVHFGVVTAVDGVSLSARPGEVLGLIGPNGAGKTTFIDALTGFVRPESGTVLLDGEPITRWSARRRAVHGVGRSFQSLELFESMTVRENLRTACDRRDPLAYLTDLVRPGRARLGAAATAVVREFGLEDDLDRRPEDLPYGRRRLVAIARAVAAEPAVLLLDEPAAGLGESDSAELGRLVRRLAHEWGIAVLLVEHDVSLVLATCDRVAVLDFGRLIAEGSPDEIRADAAVIAAYLGEEDGRPTGATGSTRGRSPGPVTAGPLVEARGVSAGYGDLAAVRDLDLDIHAGEVLAVLGANGAGKSTTLLTLAGELAPLHGELRWRGTRTNHPLHRRARAGTALVPEERSVIRSLSVGDNLRLAGVDVADALALFPELEPLLGRPAGLVSGGEQQMLTLARALARRPSLILADELSLGLAPLIVQRLLVVLRQAADDGVAVVVVEQHARQVLDIADRVIVLRRGEVVVTGTADEVRAGFEDVRRAYLTAAAD